MEKQKTSSKRKAAIKVIVAVLLIAIMTGISFAVANFVHNKKACRHQALKTACPHTSLRCSMDMREVLMIGLFLSRVNRHIRLPSITDIRAAKRIGAKPLPQCRKKTNPISAPQHFRKKATL